MNECVPSQLILLGNYVTSFYEGWLETGWSWCCCMGWLMWVVRRRNLSAVSARLYTRAERW